MSKDALADWLFRYQNPAAPEGPQRRSHLPEPLQPGDVREDGAIIVEGFGAGCLTRHGPVWVYEAQAMAAGYYGWRLEGGCAAFQEIEKGIYLWRIVR